MKLIDKDALVAEIERKINKEIQSCATDLGYSQGCVNSMRNVLSFINVLEVKEVDLEKYYHDFLQKEWFDKNCTRTISEMMFFTAKHFFELGLKANQENNVMGTLEREVKIDAGGYPYIDCYIEFYDYDKDVPLAKAGDKYKVVLIKEG